MQKANEFLTDMLIRKFANTLGGLDAIELPDELSNDLKIDELLKRDDYNLVEKLAHLFHFWELYQVESQQPNISTPIKQKTPKRKPTIIVKTFLCVYYILGTD